MPDIAVFDKKSDFAFITFIFDFAGKRSSEPLSREVNPKQRGQDRPLPLCITI
jgi:hypothetical protein